MKEIRAREFAELLGIEQPLFLKIRNAKELPEHLTTKIKGLKFGACERTWSLVVAKRFKKTFDESEARERHALKMNKNYKKTDPKKASKINIFNAWLKNHKSKVSI